MSVASENIRSTIALSSADKLDEAHLQEECSFVAPAAQLTDQLFEKLCHHPGIEGCAPSKTSSRKLQRLTLGQLNELLTDICDEIDRRGDQPESEPFLAIRLEYSPKRNQARQKLADLTCSRFTQLISSVKSELERRFPHMTRTAQDDMGSKLKGQFDQLACSLTSLPELSVSAYQLTPPTPTLSQMERAIEASTVASSDGEFSAATLSTPKPLSAPLAQDREESGRQSSDTSSIKTISYARPTTPADCRTLAERPSLNERLTKGQTLNFDCLDTLIQDLNKMIGIEQTSELEQLKGRHSKEMAALKEHIQHLEGQVIPTKNQEIARLTARMEELERKLVTARQDHAGCAAKVAHFDALIDEQASLIKTIQNSYMQLQSQLASSALMHSASKSNLLEATVVGKARSSIANAGGIFSSLWTLFSAAHSKTVIAFETAAASNADRLSALREACSVAQTLVRETERLASRSDVKSISWIVSDLQALNEVKTSCVQALSYCIVCCRDLGDKFQSCREVQEAILHLARHVRTLVDAAELIVSRAQVPSSPNEFSMSDNHKKSKSMSNDTLFDHSRYESMSTKPNSLEELHHIIKARFDFSVSTFHSLRSFIESQPEQASQEMPRQLRSDLAEALTRSMDILQAGSLLIPTLGRHSTQTIAPKLSRLADGCKKLQKCIVGTSKLAADSTSHSDAINACVDIVAALQELRLMPSNE